MTLSVESLRAGYGRIEVVHDVSFNVERGEVVALLGRNGAGKSTTLLAIAGMAKVYGGRVSMNGAQLRGAAHARAGAGLSMVLEGRSVFATLTVRQNLALARVEPSSMLDLFPELESRMGLSAGLLSGGEQQMLSLGRALLRRPSVLLIDEIDFGLAPLVSARLFGALREFAARTDTAVLLVEQQIEYAKQVADRVLVMNEGRIDLELASHELDAREREVERLYLGSALSDRPMEVGG